MDKDYKIIMVHCYAYNALYLLLSIIT